MKFAEHDTEVDTLCLSGEPERRDTAYGWIGQGYTDAAIAKIMDIPVAEVATYRAERPAWWDESCEHQYESTVFISRHTKNMMRA